MDIGRSFEYVFEDKEWPKKLLIGGLLNIVPVLHLATAGYALRMLRRSARGEELVLPEWDQIGDDWVQGLRQALALAILLLPTIPGIVSLVSIANESAGSDNPLVACCFGVTCLSALWALFVAVIYPMARAHLALTNEFASFFRFGTVLRAIGKQLGDYIVVLLLIVVVQAVAWTLGSIVCLVGVFFFWFYGQLVIADLVGQVAAASAGEAGQGPQSPAPTPEPPFVAEANAALEAEVEEQGNASAGEEAPDVEDYGGPEA